MDPLSKEAMLIALRDIRLPADAAGGGLGDLAAVIALSGAFAMVLVVALKFFLAPRLVTQGPTLQDRIDHLSGQPDDVRRIGLLHLLKEHAPEKFAAIQPNLYDPRANLDVMKLENEVRAIA